MHVKCEVLNFCFLVVDSSCSFHACCDLLNPCQSVPIDSAPRASQAKKRQALLLAVALGHAISFRTSRIFCSEKKALTTQRVDTDLCGHGQARLKM